TSETNVGDIGEPSGGTSETKVGDIGEPTEVTPETKVPQSKGAKLAEDRGYPAAEEGYHWADVNGEPVYKRNPVAGGSELEQRFYDPEAGSFKDVPEMEAEPLVDGKPRTNQQKGDFGEQKAHEFMEKDNEFKKIGTSKEPAPEGGSSRPQGIDGVYEKTNYPPPPKWVIGEAKYVSDPNGQPGYGTSKFGDQMTEGWVDGNLDQVVGKTKADLIRNEGYERWELRVDPQGNVTQKKITW
ncbi:MAG: hypothetical protein WA821_06785, partial [Anaerolineales bacterium]